MKPQMTTFRFFTSPEREEAWLQKMALRGWFLTHVSALYAYTFEQGASEERAYKIDYRSFKRQEDREDYLALFKDSGWEPVMPKAANGAFYFTSRKDGAARDIFSDEVSRAQRNLRFAAISAYSIVPAFLPLIVLYLTGNFSLQNVGYLTPGLWEMTGVEFVTHFLFETPFVVMRAAGYFLPLLPVTLVLFFVLRYYLTYRSALKQQAI